VSIGRKRTAASGIGLLTVRSVCIGVAIAAVFPVVPEAAAAPTCLQSLHDRYEPGDEVDAVGYWCVAESAGTGDHQVFAYLHDLPDVCGEVADDMFCDPNMLFSEGSPVDLDLAGGIPLGEISLEDSPQPLRGVRASLTFQLPADLAPGSYHIVVCAEPCVLGEGTSTWPSTLHVGVDPPEDQRPVRAWPLDDPAIDHLADDALLLGHDGDEVTAAAVRAEARMNDVDGSQRVETAAPPAASSPRDDQPPIGPWIVGAALVAAAAWAVSRVRGPRKRIRPGP
jgi:hypothetical protein